MQRRRAVHDAWNDLVLAWKSVSQDVADQERWTRFMYQRDRMLGLARSGGYDDLEAALEALRSPVEAGHAPSQTDRALVDLQLPRVFTAVRLVCGPASQRTDARQALEETTLPCVILLVRYPQLHEDLVGLAPNFGYSVQTVTSHQAALEMAVVLRAVALIIEVDCDFDVEAAGLARSAVAAGIRWFALSYQSDFNLRLRAVRLEAEGFIVGPLTMGALVDALDPLAFAAREEPYRVMVVDDSVTVLASVQRALKSQPNINCCAVRHPEMVLGLLVDFAPDVLLMDFYMQGCTGLELARIIRQDKAFESIPLIYLTGETREAVQLEAMRNGGDEFLTKPVSDAQLVNAVISRAERYRGLRKLMVEDSLTGLFNHVKTKALLQQAIVQAQRKGQAVSYAIVDIDHFKKVNDTHGHAVGDRVLRSLARYLRQHVRKGDIVGRYGGEEFVVVFAGAEKELARTRLDTIREGFAALVYRSEAGDFSVSFSAGLAHFPEQPAMLELMVAADRALYDAKNRGRNCVCVAPSPGAQQVEEAVEA